jgi:hypothetical protein
MDDGERDAASWPRSTQRPFEDIDLKRPGKVDRAVREKVEEGPRTPGVTTRKGKAEGADGADDAEVGELRTSGYDQRGDPRRG